MRLWLVLLLLGTRLAAAPPAPLQSALENFRADPPPGWTYTLTTRGEDKSMVERHDATKAAFDRWTLLQKDGREPTEEERKTYVEMRSRRSRGGTAPKLTEQLDLASAEIVNETAERTTYRCRLKPAERGDKTAAFLRATIVLHQPTGTVESLQLASTGEFSPTLGVTISQMKTEMSYTPPEGERPALPLRVTTQVRGRAFWFKSLDADLTVTYSDYAPAHRRSQ
jgi:hypothetical protein